MALGLIDHHLNGLVGRLVTHDNGFVPEESLAGELQHLVFKA